MRYFHFTFRYVRVMVTNKLTIVGLNSPEKTFAAFITLGSLISYVRKIFRKTNISYPLVRTCTCADERGRGGEGGRKPTILDIIFWKFSTFPKLPLTTDQEVLDIYHNKHRIRGASQVAERLKT